MPRKPFYKNPEINSEKKNTHDIWKCALYIRLSREDGDKAESDSITNQRKLLTGYVEEHEEFQFYETYVDEDYTGTNFSRPAFMQMLKDIEKKDKNCVIVKDLSRFGRDYLGAGNYLENIFPSFNCRFISILDDLDSFIKPDEITGLMVRIKSLIHDQNSQDISKKVRAAKDMLRKQGKFTDGNAPYGYYRESTNKHKLLVDENAAGIVRMIYEMYLSGMGVVKIAQKLTRLRITPCSIYKKTGEIYLENDSKGKKSWPPRTVRNILSNKTYIGALDQKRQTTRNYKDKKVIYLDDNEHIIVYGSHEPIISKQRFDIVQDELKNRCAKTSENKEKVYPLSGYLRCGECGYAMKRNPTYQKGRWYVYYKCKIYSHKGESICKHSKCIREEILYETVLAVINLQIKTLINNKTILEEINAKKSKNRIWFDYNKMIKQKEIESEKYKQLKLDCYIDWKNSSLSKEEYLYSKDEFDKIIEEIKNDIQKLRYEYEQEEELCSKKQSWLDSIIKYGEIRELSREIIVRLVEMIYVTKGNEIKVVFKHEDKFKRVAEFINTNSDITIGDKKYAAE